jgi:hypothetical protein
MLKTLLRTCLLVAAGCRLWAGPVCATTTLDQYESPNLTTNVGCTVGSLIVENFTFAVVSMTGTSPTVAAATNITVTPQTTGVLGLQFSSPNFAETAGNSVTYLLTYAEDPTGSIRSLDDALDDPVTQPGRGEIDSIGCLGGMWVGGVCSFTTTPTVTVFDDGISPVKSADTNFAGVTVLGIETTITITGGPSGDGGSASITNFGSFSIPEPATGGLAAAALVLLLFCGARLKRAQVRFQQRS